MTAITHARPQASPVDFALIRGLLHRLAYRIAQGLLVYGALMPLLVQEGARPSVPGVAVGAAFVLTLLILPRPARGGERGRPPRGNVPPRLRVLQFLG